MFWFWLAKCVPPSKLNERTVPVTFPKNHWRHPCGAKLLKPCVHWLIRMIHWLSLLVEPTNVEKSMQSDSRSKYTVICKYRFSYKQNTWLRQDYVLNMSTNTTYWSYTNIIRSVGCIMLYVACLGLSWVKTDPKFDPQFLCF